MEIESESVFQENLFTSKLLQEFNLDIEKSLKAEDDFFQFATDFEIPILEDTSSESILGSDIMMDFKNDDELFPWTLSSNDLKTIPSSDYGSFGNNIKAESPSSSSSSVISQTGSETWTSNVTQSKIKYEVETPPISPEQEINSPPSSPGSFLVFDPSQTDIRVITQTVQSMAPSSIENGNLTKTRKVFVSTADFNSLKQSTVLSPKLVPNLSSMRTNSLPVLPASSPVSTPPVILQHQLDSQLKALKRKQRMIKNRESACLSRKKKKEYVTSLENQISDLQQENIKLKQINSLLTERLTKLESNNAARRSPLLTKTKKTTAVLAILFMVSLNFNSFSFLSRPNDNFPFSDSNQRSSNYHSGRSLLWTNDDSLRMEGSNNSLNHDFTSTRSFNTKNDTSQPTCPLHINHTESIRLDSELRRWIGVDYDQGDNFSGSKGVDKPPRFKNLLNQIMLPYFSTKYSSPVSNHKLKIKSNKVFNPRMNHAIDLYNGGRLSNSNERLFEALNRRDDTFYVVSFSGDHLLLPALALNKTARPKMSLVFPALSFNDSVTNELVTMMQIDCAVTDTKLLQFREAVIPLHLRKINNTSKSHNRPEMQTRSFKPFFIKSSHKYSSFPEEQQQPLSANFP